MFTVVNHFETGQEYMSRYMAVDGEADVRGWQPRLRLKGIDVTVYAHQLFRALATLAGRVGRPGDASDWRALQKRCATAITEHMWCSEARLFTDVDGRTFERTGVKAAVGFYPMLTGCVDALRLDAMMDNLEDPHTFGTPFPLPSSSVDDPRFSAEGVWRGKRRNCPWNGRVWPMTTSHVIEGLLRCWRGGNRRGGGVGRGPARPLRAPDVHRRRLPPPQLLRALQPLHRPRLPLPRHRRLPALLGGGLARPGRGRPSSRRGGRGGVAASARAAPGAAGAGARPWAQRRGRARRGADVGGGGWGAVRGAAGAGAQGGVEDGGASGRRAGVDDAGAAGGGAEGRPEALRRPHGRGSRRPRDPPRRTHSAGGSVGVRQEHAAAPSSPAWRSGTQERCGSGSGASTRSRRESATWRWCFRATRFTRT